MDICWIKKENKTKCIVFFCGWSLDYSCISHLKIDTEFDFLFLNNYSHLNWKDQLVQSYEEVYIIAWSFGVWVASQVIVKTKNIVKKIAINGTETPIDTQKGISERLLNLTLNNWNETNRLFFNKKIGVISSERTLESQKKELQFLIQTSKNNSPKYINWDYIYISEKDTIFTKQNQINYWQSSNNNKFIFLNTLHSPFKDINNWIFVLKTKH